MENEIVLLKNNDKKDWSDLEWINEFYDFLQGEIPKTILIKNPVKLNPEEAYSIIWYLQEHFSLLPDHIEKCDNCNQLFDDHNSGYYSEEGNEIGHHFCDGCIDLSPIDNEED